MNTEEAIQFFTEAPLNFEIENKKIVVEWLEQIIQLEKFELESLNFIFCNDAYLHNINVEYLAHDTLTDIITFDNSEEEQLIEGDIFISIERVEENAKDREIEFILELKRVLAHGVLHLCGYKDKREIEALEMRAKEEWAISLANRN